MNDPRIRIYEAAPPSLRSLLASLEGYRLRWQRYGLCAGRRAAAVLKRDHWTPEQWQSWQTGRLERVLKRAVTRVPYYREWWEKNGTVARNAWSDLRNWPLLEKETLRRNSSAFVADGRSRSRMRETLTSGTTGQPIRFWYGAGTDRQWWALCEARWRMWNGVSRHDRWAMLAARLVVPLDQTDPPFWVWNSGLRQLYLSAYHLRPEALPAYLAAIEKHRVHYLWGHSSALHSLAREALRLGKRIPMKLVLSTAEPLFAEQKRSIGEAFQCPVRETYGMAEMAAAASECEAGQLHFWPELGVLELLPVPSCPGTSEIVVTTLLNPDMPLIRYRTGDLTSVDEVTRPCPCGRALPLLGPIAGRTSDILYTADGRPVAPAAVEVIFDVDLDLEEAQLVQEDFDRLSVRYVARQGHDPAIEAALRSRIEQRFGNVRIDCAAVTTIPRGPNGKFRAAACRIPPERRPRQAETT
jgi:phenylacetate-CoA ligase